MTARILALTVALLAPFSRADEPAPPDEQAHFLAGLPVRGTPLEHVSLTYEWTEHASALDAAWRKLESRQLAPIRAWSPQFLGLAATETTPLFYTFSGPDFLYAHAFFPDASTYILCGIEPIGALPDVMSVPTDTLAHSLALLRQSLDSALNFGFFISKDMRAEFEQNQLNGTLPILYIFLARSGCHIDSVEFLRVQKDGTLTPGEGANPGVKITFTTTDHAPQTLYYFSTDLSDGPVEKSGFLRWCDTFGEGSGFLKAASYLMHGGNFDTVRKFLLTHCRTLVEDDSGIPLRFFAPTNWRLRFCGAYPGPIEIFKEHFQPQLAATFHGAHPAPLPFGFGYRWQRAESTLIIAKKKTPAVENALPPEQ